MYINNYNMKFNILPIIFLIFPPKDVNVQIQTELKYYTEVNVPFSPGGQNGDRSILG